MDGLDYLSIAVLAFFSGLGASFGAELSKYLMALMRENAVLKKLKEAKKVN
jgi:hypothetical protein